MKLSLKKVGVSAALAGALLFAAPAVAQAYVPSSPNTVTVTVTSDGPVPVSGFQAGAQVTFTLVGRGVTGANIATANLPVTSASVTKTADSSGSATANVTLPAGASGTYTLAATGARAAASGSNNAGGNTGLPATGFDASSMLGIWVGGGALVLAGGTIAVATTVRRNRAEGKA
ncbi:LPXTG cell wall anchor domain-containing protein [Microbacterium testaceum]|uniref:LPXTG cell wall anchor domain-containing protein n=1 Tax=Microbacterium testaceum TaxID=2033 RepID=UPI00382A3646